MRISTADDLYAVVAELHRRKAPLPAGTTITGAINRLPADEQAVARDMLAVYDVADRGMKPAPFAQPITKESVLLAASMDSPEQSSREVADWILETTRQEAATSELLERMGSDADRPPDPPSRRDHIDAAVTAVMGDGA